MAPAGELTEMKVVAALALSLTSCALVAGECVIVLDTKPSARNAKITVLLDGKPQGNTKLLISLPAGQGWHSMVTDSQGAAVLKDLQVGTSCITATSENKLSGGLCLDVSAQSTNDINSFQMLLAPPRPNPFDEKVKRMEQSTPPLRLKTLAGVVLDPAGGVISKAEVQIYKRGSYPRDPVMTLKTDDEGRFSAALEPNVYTVIMRRLGFRPEFQGIEISRDGKDDELRQILQLSPSDTCGDAT